MFEGRFAAIALILLAASCGAPPATGTGASPGPETAAPEAIGGVAVPPAPATRPAVMLRLTLRLDGDGVELLSSSEAPNTVNRRDPHRASPTFFRVIGEDGSVLEERGFRLETELRSETAGADGALEGTRVPVDDPVFSVAVPGHAGLSAVRFYRAPPGGGRDGAVLLGEVRP